MLPDYFKIITGPTSGFSSNVYVRTGHYGTNSPESIARESAALESANEMPKAMRSFISEQADFILNTQARQMGEGRFSCMGAIDVWKRGRVYFTQPADADVLLEDSNTMKAFLGSLSDFAQREGVKKYQENIESNPQKTEIMNTVFYGVFDKFFFGKPQALIYFGKLLKKINDVDAQMSPVAEGHSRDPLNPNYILSIGGIPYFANISYGYESDDHQSIVPSILLVPQAIFEHQKKLPTRDGGTVFTTWSHIIRDNLTTRYGSYIRGLNVNGEISPIANFIPMASQEDVGDVAATMGLERSALARLVDPSHDDSIHRCPFHSRILKNGAAAIAQDPYPS